MPKFGKIALLPQIMRDCVNEMLDENMPEEQIAAKITAVLQKVDASASVGCD